MLVLLQSKRLEPDILKRFEGLLRKDLERIEQECGDIEMDELEADRRDSSRGGTLLSAVEDKYFKQACNTTLLGIPLILWDKRVGLQPSPFKRIYREFCSLHNSHGLRATSAKVLYLKLRAESGAPIKKKPQKWSEELIKMLHKRVDKLKDKMTEKKNQVYLNSVDHIASASFNARTAKKKKRGTKESPKAVAAAPKDLSAAISGSDSSGKSSPSKTAATAGDSSRFERMFKHASANKGKRDKAGTKGGGHQTNGSGKGKGEEVGFRSSDEEYQQTYDRLFALAKKHITRSTKMVQYAVPPAKPPLEIPSRDLMVLVLRKMAMASQKKAIFRRYFLSEASTMILHAMFWIMHLKFFQSRGSQPAQQWLIRQICHHYVNVLNGRFTYDNDSRAKAGISGLLGGTPASSTSSRSGPFGVGESSGDRPPPNKQHSLKPEDLHVLALNKDIFFQTFPYALTLAVTDGFWFLMPASRHMVGNDHFKQEVSMHVNRVLFGMDVCSSTLLTMRRRLFPNEKHSDAVATATHSTNDSGGSGPGASPKSGDAGPETRGSPIALGGMAQRRGSTGRSGARPGKQGRLQLPPVGAKGNRGNSPSNEGPQPFTGRRAPSRAALQRDAFTIEPPRPVTRPTDVRQLRQLFITNRTTALVQRYLDMPHQSLPEGACYKVHTMRTVPVARCRVGGVANFRRTASRRRIHKELRNRFDRTQKESMVQSIKNRQAAISSERHIDSSCRAVLRKGQGFVRHFTMELMSLHSEAQQRGGKKGTATDSTNHKRLEKLASLATEEHRHKHPTDLKKKLMSAATKATSMKKMNSGNQKDRKTQKGSEDSHGP